MISQSPGVLYTCCIGAYVVVVSIFPSPQLTIVLSILIDGTDVSVSQYGIVENDGNIGTISVSRAGDTVSLTVVPVGGITPITLRYMRMGLKA